MQIVSKELAKLLTNPDFRGYHHACDNSFNVGIQRFLAATMDEVRLRTSEDVVLEVLKQIGISDLAKFREAVLRRELLGEMAYEKQRDHTSHTLYNYLLGWYFFIHCDEIREALTAELAKRGVPNPALSPFEDISTFFGSVWQYASLLHDIGYMFEGSVSKRDFEASSKQAKIGAIVAREYFNRGIWIEHNIDLGAMRAELFSVLGSDLKPPSFDMRDTLGDIADELRTVGNLDDLVAAVRDFCDGAGTLAGRKPNPSDFLSDGFELWAHHYERFGSPGMALRIRSARKAFNGMIDTGLPGPNIRLLDHGVCGGLLQLIASTYYYRLRATALKISEPKPRFVRAIVDAGDWSPAFWWAGIVWGTAAVGIHNIQQIDLVGKLDPGWPGKLSMSDDPLAYLGILVDIMQEWNRYSVFKDLEREPIQGIEVELGAERHKIVMQFTQPNAAVRAAKMRKNLEQALNGWSDFLEVNP